MKYMFASDIHGSAYYCKTFGTVGAVLTGLTVAAQFLFGKGKAVK